MKQRPTILRHIRILDWMLIVAILSGVILGLLWTVCAVYKRSVVPFPTFGGHLSRLENRTFPVFGLLWLAWAVAIFRRAVRRRAENSAIGILYVTSLLATMMGCLAWIPSLSMLNALFDFSPKIATPIRIRGTEEHTFQTTRFGATSSASVYVSRIDHPDERVGLSWPGCAMPEGVEPAPYATLVIGRGAFGVPWFALPVEGCRALTVSDLPLFGTFVLGAGKPMVLIALSNSATPDIDAHAYYEQRRRELLSTLTNIAAGDPFEVVAQGERAALYAKPLLTDDQMATLRGILAGLASASSKEEKAIGQRALSFVKPIFDLWNDELVVKTWLGALYKYDIDIILAGSDVPPEATLTAGCTHCRSITKKDLNRSILRLFTGVADPWAGENHIYLADGQGRRGFSAKLTDIKQAPALRDKVASLLAPPPP